MLNMNKRIAIQQLLAVGCTHQAIAGQLKCHRNTVGNIKKEAPLKEKPEREPPPHPLDPHRAWITDKLAEKLSFVRIAEDLRELQGYAGGYNALRRYVKSRRLKPKGEAYTVLHTAPGEEAQVDFGYFGLTPDNTGKRRKTWVFVMTLGFSRLGFYCHAYDQSVATFIDCHEQAFAHFGGVPARVKIDNLKAGVIEHGRYAIAFNRQYQDYAKHAGFLIHACAVRKPEQKGKVESGVKYVKYNFFAGRSFRDENDLKARLRKWQDQAANRRVHGTTREIPAEVFAQQEKAHLQPLPTGGWETMAYAVRKVGKTCHIVFEKNYYSVPYAYIDREVTLSAGKNLVMVSDEQHERIATHLRVTDAVGVYRTDPSHYPPHKSKSQTEYQAEHAQQMAQIGEHAAGFFEQYREKHGNYWARGIKGIIALTGNYDRRTVDLACKRAGEFEAYSYQVVCRICRTGLWQDAGSLPAGAGSRNGADASPALRGNGNDGDSELQRPLAYYARLCGLQAFFFFQSLYDRLFP
jgi:transposase